MLDYKTKIKKSVSFCPNGPSIEKKTLNNSGIINSNSQRNILKNNTYNNKKINNDLNTINITNYKSKLNKNNSHNYSGFNIHKNKNEINIINNSINNESNNKTILIDNKKFFKNIYINKKTINLKNPILKSYIKNNKHFFNKINNSNSNLTKSINHVDSKTLEETKSKIEITNNDMNINADNNNSNNINNNIEKNNVNININIENNNSNNNIEKINVNESLNNQNNKSDNIILPKILNSKKKNYRKKNVSFFIKSKHKKISASDIYLHYLKENEKDKYKVDHQSTIVDFAKYLKNNDNKKFNYGFEKIYGDDISFINRINEIKKNKNLAYKNDFNIQDYQRTLLKLLKKRVSDKSLEKLDNSYKLFNERNFGMMIPRGRYISLADKLKDFLSKDIFEKVKRLDRNYIIFLEKKEELKHRNSLEFKNKNNFYKILNKTIISFNRKKNQNRSI